MTDDYDVFEPAEKPAPQVKAEPKPENDKPVNMTEEEFAAVRRDVRRMWTPEPEETR